MMGCTSVNCPYKDSCNRQYIEDESYNYEYVCNENSGFEDYVKSNKSPASLKEGYGKS